MKDPNTHPRPEPAEAIPHPRSDAGAYTDPAPGSTDRPDRGGAETRSRSFRDWSRYFDAVAGKPPRETLIAALDAFDREAQPDGEAPADCDAAAATPLCVDLGCGDGRDTVELLRRGWRVLAIDGHPEAFARMLARPGIAPSPRLTLQLCTLEEAEPPPCRLVNASYCLPFCLPEDFDALWHRIRAAIQPGGRFAGQLFGERHTWASLSDRSHHTRPMVDRLLAGLEIEHLEEQERDDTDATGQPVHWHLFDVVARRPSA